MSNFLRATAPLAVGLAAATAVLAPAADAATPAEKRAQVLVNLAHPSGLDRLVRQVSDPSSPRYRHYLTVDELTARFGASRKARKATVGYLRARGLEAEVGVGGTYVLAEGTPAQVAEALPTAGLRGTASAGSTALTVPPALRGDVTEAIRLGSGEAPARDDAPPVARAAATKTPAERLNGLSEERGSALQRTGTPTGCPEGVASQTGGVFGFTPNQYLEAYGFDRLHAQGLQGQGMHIALVETGGFVRSDVETFAACFGSKMPVLRQYDVAGTRADDDAPMDEATLDVEVMLAALPKLERMDVYSATGGTAAGNLLTASAAAIAGTGQHPDVISISYGICEPLLSLRQVGGIGLARTFNHVFQVAAASGITVMNSSGDYGYTSCTQQVPNLLPSVEVPSSLHTVTSVGGTNLTLDARNAITLETAWNDSPLGDPYGGGGGRSVIFERPWWQQAPGVGGTARQVPDISALADRYPGYAIFCTANPSCRDAEQPQGGWTTIGGTSAAAPLMASGALLANQAARKAGQRNLGFVNPLLYGVARSKQAAQLINDVTIGSTDTSLALTEPGGPFSLYHAKKGYDMATGLGSIDVAELNRIALRAGRGTPSPR